MEEERYIREREELVEEIQTITLEKEKEAVELAEESPVKPLQFEVERGKEGEAVVEYLRYFPILSLSFHQRIRITEFFTLFPLNPYFCRSISPETVKVEGTSTIEVIPAPSFTVSLLLSSTTSILKTINISKTLITAVEESITVEVV